MSGKRYQSGYDDGFKAGEWAGRRAPNPLLPLVRELREVLEYYAKARDIYAMTGVWQLAEVAYARANAVLAGEPQEGKEEA